MTWAAFMEVALYDPVDGFYAGERHPASTDGGHFATSPHVSPVFARLLAAMAAQTYRALGGPDGSILLDVGAGDGTLLRGIADAGTPAMRPAAVEPSPAGRRALEAAGFDSYAALADVPPFTGLAIANELFDNVPFHLVRARASQLVEVAIAADGDGLRVTEEDPTVPARAAMRRLPLDGEDLPVSPASIDLVRALAARLERGYAVIIDYGFAGDEPAEPVRGYRAHGYTEDLLSDPGSSDVTGPVDIDALARAARAAGLHAWGPVRQRDALMTLGYRRELDRMRTAQREAERAGRWRDALAGFGARGEAAMLVDASGLGSLKWLVLGTDGLPEPTITRGNRGRNWGRPMLR